eukprot:TRINITY_DN11954_c0_g2_i1.p1 TRINITY_DN11954_c0_g2~~TRINITY_DN11954_c0_g2_i1.p1  ORF type:complete len:683 (-),score=151.57 TRINITY_DN11954_c0_g2_i1:1032-3080(-)
MADDKNRKHGHRTKERLEEVDKEREKLLQDLAYMRQKRGKMKGATSEIIVSDKKRRGSSNSGYRKEDPGKYGSSEVISRADYEKKKRIWRETEKKLIRKNAALQAEIKRLIADVAHLEKISHLDDKSKYADKRIHRLEQLLQEKDNQLALEKITNSNSQSAQLKKLSTKIARLEKQLKEKDAEIAQKAANFRPKSNLNEAHTNGSSKNQPPRSSSRTTTLSPLESQVLNRSKESWKAFEQKERIADKKRSDKYARGIRKRLLTETGSNITQLINNAKNKPSVKMFEKPKRLGPDVPLKQGHKFNAGCVERIKALEELLATEQVYVTSLHIALNYFRQPFLEMAEYTADVTITPMEINVIFGYMNVMYALHKKFLKAMKKCFYDDNDKQTLGQVILEITPALRLYSNYIRNFEKANEIIKKCRAKPGGKFNEIQNALVTNTGRKLQLEDYLIMPVQRLPRYEMLLQRILKTTDSTNPDYRNMQEALGQVQHIISLINQKKSADLRRQQLIEIQTRVSGYDGLLKQGRVPKIEAFANMRLVDKGPPPYEKKGMSIGMNYLSDMTECYLFLFSDALMVTQKRKNLFQKINYDCRYFFFLDTIVLNCSIDSMDINSIQIIEINKSTPTSDENFPTNSECTAIVLYFPDNVSTMLWYNEMRNLQQNKSLQIDTYQLLTLTQEGLEAL